MELKTEVTVYLLCDYSWRFSPLGEGDGAVWLRSGDTVLVL